MKYGTLPFGSDRKSTHLHVAEAPGSVNDQEFFDEVSGGGRRGGAGGKQSVSPELQALVTNSTNVIRNHAQMTHASLLQAERAASP